MFSHDFLNIRDRNEAVPHLLRINDDRGPVLALIQAAGLARSHLPLQSMLRDCRFERPAQRFRILRSAARPRMALRPTVAAHEHMSLEEWHDAKL
jgi:hypothetical protein